MILNSDWLFLGIIRTKILNKCTHKRKKNNMANEENRGGARENSGPGLDNFFDLGKEGQRKKTGGL